MVNAEQKTFKDLSVATPQTALVTSYLPEACGIAVFSSDLRRAIAGPDHQSWVVAVGRDTTLEYPKEVRYRVSRDCKEEYVKVARQLQEDGVTTLCVQHEFGLFGGDAGSYILDMLQAFEGRVVVTFHTILDSPDSAQKRVMKLLRRRADRAVVMSERGKRMLQDIYGFSPDQVDIIPHGVPTMERVRDKRALRKNLGLPEDDHILLTFGLLGPGKGIETAIAAMPEILTHHPNATYVVLGATHPNLVAHEGERYREGLIAKAKALGVAKHVHFVNAFVERPRLLDYLSASDSYVLPYPNPQQITSGTLAYALTAGCVVFSTPFWHAQELLDQDRGEFFEFGSSQDLAKKVCASLKDPERRDLMAQRAWAHGVPMRWPQVGTSYRESFKRALVQPRPPVDAAVPPCLPPSLAHLQRLTDDVGIVQHARMHLPDRSHGYCLDDNARALIFALEAVAMMPQDSSLELQRAIEVYASFLDHAYDEERACYRNFMGYGRQWLEAAGSPDSHGRAIWALGVCLEKAMDPLMRQWAREQIHRVLPCLPKIRSMRALAYSSLGLGAYLRAGGDHHEVRGHYQRQLLILRDAYLAHRQEGWLWYEPHALTYGNARLPHALLDAYEPGDEAFEQALESLHWLMSHQLSEQGNFRAIGSQGFWERAQRRPARHDQQPIEAGEAVEACLCAWRKTGEATWFDLAKRAHDWFYGRNDLGQPLWCEATGGCFDGLHADRVNQNQGAESTLALLLSQAYMALWNRGSLHA